MKTHKAFNRDGREVSVTVPAKSTFTMFDYDKARRRPIGCVAEAKTFIHALIKADKLFHFEDDPTTVGNFVGGEWVSCFTEEEAVELSARVEEMYRLDWSVVGHECPIGYALEAMGE